MALLSTDLRVNLPAPLIRATIDSGLYQEKPEKTYEKTKNYDQNAGKNSEMEDKAVKKLFALIRNNQ